MNQDPKSSAAYLVIERGKDAGKRIRLIAFPICIGREASCDIILRDEEVSRQHLRIKQRGRLFIAEDLESRNGTYVNGDRVLNSILKSGDRLLVGSTEMTFLSSGSEIELARDIIEFNMVVAEELGFNGPIAVEALGHEAEFTPVRIPLSAVGSKLGNDAQGVKTLFDLHGNILVIDQLEEACSALLKAVLKIMPYANRAAFFVWSESRKQVIPMAARHRQKRQKFLLSQRAFEDVLLRKQILVLVPKPGLEDDSGRIRLVFPMGEEGPSRCLLHVEIDDPSKSMPNREFDMLAIFLGRCMPSFETLLLRKEMDSWMIGMVDTIISTIEANDTYTRGHSERVSRYSMAIGEELRLNRETKKLLMVSSLVHDVGKIGIPDNILKKASLLTAEEYEEMKLHPSIGADIMSHVPEAQRFLSGVKHHHEKWDGSGYPDGLEGEDIPFFARIVALADVFDAMVSGRSYSGFLDQADAIERLDEEKEIFDPEIFKAFVRAYENGAITQKTSTQNNLKVVEDSSTAPAIIDESLGKDRTSK